MSENIQVPQGWEVKKLGEVFKESRILGSKGDKAKKITLKLWGKGVVEKKEYIEGSATTQYYIRKEGQFIYSKLDFLNQAFAIIPKEYDGYETTIDLPCFDIDTSINPIFILEYIKQPSIYINYGKLFANGGRKARRVQVADFLNMPIPVPPLEEQKKIAEILSLWDKAIEQTKGLIAYKEKQKKGLMQALLTGKKRLQGFTDEWKTYTIKELGEVKTGKTPSTTKADYYNGDIMFITPTDIKNKFTSNTDRYLTNAGLKKSIFIPKNSILITCIASIGKNTINSESCACNQQINAIIPNDSNYYEYLYYHISYNTPYIEKFAGNNATAIINKSTFEEIDITIPPLDEQKAIADILSSADKEIELLNKQLELYTEQKKGLMQNLLTGKVRV